MNAHFPNIFITIMFECPPYAGDCFTRSYIIFQTGITLIMKTEKRTEQKGFEKQHLPSGNSNFFNVRLYCVLRNR